MWLERFRNRLPHPPICRNMPTSDSDGPLGTSQQLYLAPGCVCGWSHPVALERRSDLITPSLSRLTVGASGVASSHGLQTSPELPRCHFLYVMSRGDRCESIIRDDFDGQRFLEHPGRLAPKLFGHHFRWRSKAIDLKRRRHEQRQAAEGKPR